MASFNWPPQAGSSGGGVSVYANQASLPGSAADGTLAVTSDTDTLYAYNVLSSSWVVVATPADHTTVNAATSANTANTLVKRDGSGNFAAGTITASLTGHASLDVPLTSVGANNGVASLDGSGKVPVSQLPSVVMEYQGAWNPTTNSPALADGTGTNGYVYYVTALKSGAVSGLTDPSMVNFQIGDLIIYSASVGKWQLVTPAAGVQSVNGSQGAVTVNAINQLTGDVTAGPASGSASAAATVAKIGGTTVGGSTGTGNVVFSTSPTLVTPSLGTPSSVVLTLGTGLPLTTGVTGILGGANGGYMPVSTISSATSAGGYNRYLANTTSAAFTVTLPSSPSAFAVVELVDDALTWGTHSLTVSPGGSQQIIGLSVGTPIVCNVSGAWIKLTWDNVNAWWCYETNGFQPGPASNPVVVGTSSGYVPSTGLPGRLLGSTVPTGTIGQLVIATGGGTGAVPTVGNYGTTQSLSVPAGVWLVSGTQLVNAATGCTRALCALSLTTNAADNSNYLSAIQLSSTSQGYWLPASPRYFNFSTATTVYLVVRSEGAAFGSVDATVSQIQAVRVG